MLAATAQTEGAYVIIGNLAEPDAALRLGARLVILQIPGSPEQVLVRGLSRGGRRIRKWIPASRVRDMRVAWEHRPGGESFPTKEAAENMIRARFQDRLPS